MDFAKRNMDERPYSADEMRVAQFFFDAGTGGGPDPIGSIIASHQYLAAERNCLRADNARLVTEREAERERCAKIAEDWLTTFGDQKPQHVTAQTWACDAVRDIAQLIRSGQP